MAAPALKLTVEQIHLAIRLLTEAERDALRQRLVSDPPGSAEQAFAFWDDPGEDLYDDLIPAGRR